MDHFNYKDGELFAEGVALKDIAKKYGTPTYVYSKATLERHARAYIDSFESMSGLVCFSVKALSNISILKTLRISGCGFDLSLIHISEPTRPLYISYAVFCLKKN